MVMAGMLNARYMMSCKRRHMSDILFIKTSSLGDVIHHMPALTEARAARPDARFAWLVEEAFAPLVRLHPAVDEVIPVAWRRWRKSLYAPATLAEIAGSLRAIRAAPLRRDRRQPGPAALRPSSPASRAAGATATTAAASASRWPPPSTMSAIASAANCTRSSAIASSPAWRSAIRRRARPTSGSTARAWPARAALRRAAARHGAAGQRNGRRSNWIALGKALGREASSSCCRGARPANARAASAIAAALPRARVPERHAARRGRPPHRRRAIRGRRRYRAPASRRRARRAAGGDLCRQQARSDRPGRQRAARRAGRARRAAVGGGSEGSVERMTRGD